MRWDAPPVVAVVEILSFNNTQGFQIRRDGMCRNIHAAVVALPSAPGPTWSVEEIHSATFRPERWKLTSFDWLRWLQLPTAPNRRYWQRSPIEYEHWH